MSLDDSSTRFWIASVVAFLCATLTPVVLIMALAKSFASVFFVLILSALHVVFLALPVFVILRRLRKLNAIAIGVSGFLIGLIPFATFTFPGWYASSGSYAYQDGKDLVWAISNGHMTQPGWIEYFVSAFEVGLIGLLAATVFAAILRVAQGVSAI
jgi:hypothetical protein